MSEYHESPDLLPERVKDQHRAIKSLMEELEAVDWYNQRIAASADEELKGILAHNRDEEIEHAAMTLEWLRRHMDGWDEELRTYLFTERSILEAEQGIESQAKATDGDLGIGGLKGDD